MWLARGWPCTVTPYSTSTPITRRTLTRRDYDGDPTPTPTGRTGMDPVQAQVDAYNAHDIVITDASGRPIMAGVETIREEYGAMFAASPDLQAEILGRVSTGGWTVDHERVSRAGETREVLVAYQVADGQIARVLMLG